MDQYQVFQSRSCHLNPHNEQKPFTTRISHTNICYFTSQNQLPPERTNTQTNIKRIVDQFNSINQEGNKCGRTDNNHTIGNNQGESTANKPIGQRSQTKGGSDEKDKTVLVDEQLPKDPEVLTDEQLPKTDHLQTVKENAEANDMTQNAKQTVRNTNVKDSPEISKLNKKVNFVNEATKRIKDLSTKAHSNAAVNKAGPNSYMDKFMNNFNGTAPKVPIKLIIS